MPALLFKYPTSPFTILEPQNPWIGEFYAVQERRATDKKGSKIVKGLVGYVYKENYTEDSRLDGFKFSPGKVFCLSWNEVEV